MMKKIPLDLEGLLEKIKPHLTRRNAEWASLGLILICSLTLFTGRIAVQKTLTLDNGNIIYHGYVQANKMNGQGKVTFANGDVYEGNFSNGSFDGKGTFTAKEGWTYVGDFKKGQAHGQGKLTTQTKTVYEGTFKQGIYQHED